MNILLIGDYSGVHSELAKALKSLGHYVVVVSDGDGYKNFDRDINLQGYVYKGYIGKVFNLLCDFMGVKGLFLYFKNRKVIGKLNNFDVVQLINPIAITAFGSLANILLIRTLKNNNKNLFLCALGDDYDWVTQNLKSKFKYSALDNLDRRSVRYYIYSLRYVYGLLFPYCHRYAVNNVEKIIPGLVDYEMVYDQCDKISNIIGLPLSSDFISSAKEKLNELESNNSDEITNDINIFHGWQNGKEYRKGNDKFHMAAKIILDKYGSDRIKYKIIKSIPYNEYIKRFNDCDLFFDQTYSYDRGVNGILGMSKGKVVFSGFEKEKLGESNVTPIGVNATSDVTQLVNDISFLIENPKEIKKIKINALKYVIKNHAGIEVAKDYLDVWCVK